MLDLALFENTYLQDLREANRVFWADAHRYLKEDLIPSNFLFIYFLSNIYFQIYF